MATAAIIPAETVTLIAEALSGAEREMEWVAIRHLIRTPSYLDAHNKVRAAKAALQMITDGQ